MSPQRCFDRRSPLFQLDHTQSCHARSHAAGSLRKAVRTRERVMFLLGLGQLDDGCHEVATQALSAGSTVQAGGLIQGVTNACRAALLAFRAAAR
jgi:hypothetical protein